MARACTDPSRRIRHLSAGQCDGRQQDAHPPRRAMELQRSGQWHALRHSRRVSVRSWRRAPMMMIDIKLGNCRFGQRDEYISKAMADIQTFCYRNHVKAIQGYELHLPPARVLAFTLFLQCSSHHHLDFRVSGLAAVFGLTAHDILAEWPSKLNWTSKLRLLKASRRRATLLLRSMAPQVRCPRIVRFHDP